MIHTLCTRNLSVTQTTISMSPAPLLQTATPCHLQCWQPASLSLALGCFVPWCHMYGTR
jgi:hypothetical protein